MDTWQSGGKGAQKMGSTTKKTGKTGAAVVSKGSPTMGSGYPKGSFCGVGHGKKPGSYGKG